MRGGRGGSTGGEEADEGVGVSDRGDVMRGRLSYANVAMTLALVFAMSGGAYAASKYVITSTKQISPKVLKA